MLAILAQQNQANPIVAFLPLLLMGVVFYFLLIRPQNQRRRAQMEMQSGVDIEDEYGTVMLEIAPNTEIRVSRAAIAQRLVDEDEYQDEDEVQEAEPGS